MSRIPLIAVLLVGLLISVVDGQDVKKSETKKTELPQKTPAASPKPSGGDAAIPVPGDVEVQFHNGSKVRLIIQTEKIEVATVFGKLDVPIMEIRSVEFGLHLADGVADKIDAALKGLKSGDYRERERSNKALLDLGPQSYPAVLSATQSKDAEVATRAKDLVQKLKKKHPKNALKTSADDKIVTNYFTIVGRILTPTVTTKAEYFGVIQHQIANMHSLRAFQAPSQELEVSVDAAKYAKFGQWMDSGFQVDGRSALIITAKGVVDTWPQQPGQWMAGPKGVQGGNQMMVRGGGGIVIGGPGGGAQNNGGALLGKIGENGTPFLIGDQYEATPDVEGKLFLQIGPSPWGCDSTGKYDLVIKRGT